MWTCTNNYKWQLWKGVTNHYGKQWKPTYDTLAIFSFYVVWVKQNELLNTSNIFRLHNPFFFIVMIQKALLWDNLQGKCFCRIPVYWFQKNDGKKQQLYHHKRLTKRCLYLLCWMQFPLTQRALLDFFTQSYSMSLVGARSRRPLWSPPWVPVTFGHFEVL